jgi:hypothetical protein
LERSLDWLEEYMGWLKGFIGKWDEFSKLVGKLDRQVLFGALGISSLEDSSSLILVTKLFTSFWKASWGAECSLTNFSS